MLSYKIIDNVEILENILSVFQISTKPLENNKFEHLLTLDVNNYNISLMNWINSNLNYTEFSFEPRNLMKSKLLITVQYRKPYNRFYTSEMYNYLDKYDEIFIYEKHSEQECHVVKFLIKKYNENTKRILNGLLKWNCSYNEKFIEKLENPKEYIDKNELLKLQVEWNLLENVDDKDYVISKYNLIFARYIELTNKILNEE